MNLFEMKCVELWTAQCTLHIAHAVVLQVDGQHLLDPGVGEKEVSCC